VTYSVKEMFYTLQGEGANAGRAAVFCRFSGCNLWSGLERDRARSVCQFCDTDFVGIDGTGGGKFDSADKLARSVAALWPRDTGQPPFVVLTGGEPLLQVDSDLVDALHKEGFTIAVETNGTVRPPQGIDWICMSPKQGSNVLVRDGNELKLVFPQNGLDPQAFTEWQFEHFFLQPMDGPDRIKNTKLAIEYCQAHPKWRLSTQIHKIVGIR